ncbi:hypothetical protein [Tumebacillus flagellatus]|uniref:Uncharacterized protein n=1 Tax=Tumebacillus flagellatus TaxID=1157490 RepID=A0A074LSS5_9BACL|nr:hypothetical protein [Tumebacillus flagellatus]KEO85196.1 hypothetical protein EL26_01160 [Tumebacillus flagellatus]
MESNRSLQPNSTSDLQDLRNVPRKESLTPEDVVLDYLIGEHELEQLRHGFQASLQGHSCNDQK